MSVDANDVIRSACIMGGLGSDQYVNVFFTKYESAAIFDDQQISDDIALFLEGIYDELDAFISDQVTFTRVTNQNVTKDELMPDSVFPTLTTGAATDDVLPPQTAALLVGRTLRPRVQRRMYIPGITEFFNNDGNLTAGLKTAVLAAGAFFIGSQTINTRLYRSVVLNQATMLETLISSVFVVDDFRTQRRRTLGRGF